MYATSKSSPRGTNQSVFPKSSSSAAAVAVAGIAPSSARVPLPPVGGNAQQQQVSAPAGSSSARAAALTYPNGRRTINLSQLQAQQQPVLVSSDADVVPWQKVHRGSIPVWEQERLLREVLAAMLLADNGNPALTQSEAATAGTSRSLHNRATQAANDVVSEFVRSAIIGGGAGAFALNQQQQQQQRNSSSSGGADADALLLGGQRAGTTGSRPGSVSLTALRLPSTDGGGANGGDADEDQQWVANVRDRRQLQLERLLRDAQNEAALLKQQLDDITRAHDDTQRALNQAYHEYDKLQQSVLSRMKGAAAAAGAKSSNDDAGAK